MTTAAVTTIVIKMLVIIRAVLMTFRKKCPTKNHSCCDIKSLNLHDIQT